MKSIIFIILMCYGGGCWFYEASSTESQTHENSHVREKVENNSALLDDEEDEPRCGNEQLFEDDE